MYRTIRYNLIHTIHTLYRTIHEHNMPIRYRTFYTQYDTYRTIRIAYRTILTIMITSRGRKMLQSYIIPLSIINNIPFRNIIFATNLDIIC